MRTEATDEKSAIYLRCPQSLPRAIKQAASGSMISASAYVRMAVLSQLRRDGYDPKTGDVA